MRTLVSPESLKVLTRLSIQKGICCVQLAAFLRTRGIDIVNMRLITPEQLKAAIAALRQADWLQKEED